MNIFSRVKNGIAFALDRWQRKQSAAQGVETHKGQDLPPAAPVHMIRLRASSRPIFGPVFDVPREHHHLSRETCRHYLRTRFFAAVSQGNPLMSRRDRRRHARLFAKLEYRRMMQDPTNTIDSEMEAMLRRKEALEVGAAA